MATTEALALFEQDVKKRIKEIIGDLIPEPMWDKLVRDSIIAFKTVDLPKIVREELSTVYKNIIKEEFNKPEWQDEWLNGKRTASEMVKKIIIENGAEILAGMIGSQVQSIIQDLRYRQF